MDHNLQRYLNDHLAGSAGAVKLIDNLATRQEIPEEAAFFHSLKEKVEADREQLRDLLTRADLEESTALQVAGKLTATASKLKLDWEGMEPGELGMLEALEMLTLGIQGKRMLWVLLAELAPAFPEWEGIRFSDLELEAIEQRDAVEERRLQHGRDSLIDAERRAERVA
ncbi:MAG: hypothetical protein EOP83_05030 [Verrucomicrobiaceae bacterium]|nr:MAG: hypothetical protein EOP83_05030 [Verrucomicrobiaceae bacterium]